MNIFHNTKRDSLKNLDIIIPTLNEAEYIGSTLKNIFARAANISNISVWVSDCASSDATLEVARRYPVNIPVYEQPPTSRASAMNFAADRSSGDVLLFIHADACVPRHFDKLIFKTLAKRGTVGGAFEFAMDGKGLLLRMVEWVDRLRYRVIPAYYGDQGIFVTRATFIKVGKFPDVKIMEDSLFCRKVWKTGRMRLIKKKMVVSSRRFDEDGAFRVYMFDYMCGVREMLGLSNEKYAKSYNDNNRARGIKIRKIPK